MTNVCIAQGPSGRCRLLSGCLYFVGIVLTVGAAEASPAPAANIISGLVMLVKNKGRDIVILRTIGASRGAILRIFLCRVRPSVF